MYYYTQIIISMYLIIITRSHLLYDYYLFIGDRAFERCSSLTQILLTPGLTVIGFAMFDMYNGGASNPTLLGTVTIPSSLTSIGEKY